ncbi:tRNA dihydrouridine synthase DusB [Eubacteriales bacterium OttesenSCG-928-N13]|nr:tRNA dihydrouridine synthase DusB [Eubacteriales bacterium OttesenSCG-928-N13]
MQIGNLVIPEGAALAPMAGVTDCTFRPLCKEQGAAFSVTEMLSAKGYSHLSRNVRAVEDLLRRVPDEGILGVQLFGHEAEWMVRAVEQLQQDFAFIDINMGCPVPKIVGNGEGSALLKQPEQIGPLVRAVVDASRVPVTVKIRSGWDKNHVNAVTVAQIIEQAGASAIAVHARTRDQFYSGQADWQVIADVKRAVCIPVIGNGDIRSGQDAVKMKQETGCDAVMVGRAAQGNPWIFREILCAMKGEPYQRPEMPERIQMALRHMDIMIPIRGERGTLLEMRKHISWYLHGARGAAQLRARINGLTSLDEVRAALHECMHAEETISINNERGS